MRPGKLLKPGQNFLWDQLWGQNWGQANFKSGQAIGARPGFIVCRELQSKYDRGYQVGRRNDEHDSTWNPTYTFSVECTRILLLSLYTHLIGEECTWRLCKDSENFWLICVMCQLVFNKTMYTLHTKRWCKLAATLGHRSVLNIHLVHVVIEYVLNYRVL